jgi:zinc protease
VTATIDLQFGERRLANGLTLVAIRNPGVETFAAALGLDVDLRDEARGEEGLANLVGDCLDEGSTRRDGVAIAVAAEDLGAALEGASNGGSVACPAAAARKSLDLLVEIVATPSFPAREVARVQAEIRSEILSDLEDPQTVAGLRFRKEVYGKHPFARPSQGTKAGISKLRRQDLVRFHKKWFTTGNGLFVAAGPDPVEKTLDLLGKAARPLRSGTNVHAALPPIPRPNGFREVHVPMPREQVHVYLGHPGIRRTDPDYYALLVMDHVLGTGPGFTSRISRKLRDEQGLCYSVSAAITSSAGEEPGTFTAYIGTSPEHRQKAIDGFLAEMRRIRLAPPTADELKDVQDYLTGSFVFGLERNMNLVRYGIRAKRFGLGLDYLQRYPDLIRGVTLDDVQRVADRHLQPDDVVVVSAGA